MKFEGQDLRNGFRNEQMQRETPNTFSEINGSASINPDGQMKPSSGRMAGAEGARAMEMMTNPEEAKRTANWMRMFGMSNEGMQFNQAKMGLPPQE